jgi:tRNA dimethylallyltransferase
MAEFDEKDQPRVVILVGSTGVGKSKLAMEWVEALGGEILSADSMQVYRYMDIGTDKPSPDEQRRIKHHLIDLVTPDQPFHADQFRTLGRQVMDQLHQNGKPIWVVGDTGLYIKTLIQGLFSSPKIDPCVRQRLKQEASEKGGDFLYQRLQKVDPKTASFIHPRDLFRTIRALEVFDSTKIPISFFREQHRFGEKPYSTLKIGLDMDRGSLYRRIEQRVDRMVERGFLEEVKKLLERGYGRQLKPMQGLGYKQMVQFLHQEIEWGEAIRQIKRETRHYAKRQSTWFKADPEIHWLDASTDRQKVIEKISSFLKRGGKG